jgi:uncharacterized protein (DUF1697 family)
MGAQIVLLRGINLGAHNRIPMPKLREALQTAGFDGVRTYVASGNVVVSSSHSADRVATSVRELIAAGFGLEIAVIVRTRAQLAAVVKANPLGEVATDPKRYLVTFLSAKPDAATVAKVRKLAAEPEEFVLRGREVYSWHPDGLGRSKLSTKLAANGLGVIGTGRNWTTVTTLLEMASAA